MYINDGDIFYCIKSGYTQGGNSIKGDLYIVDTIYLLKSNSAMCDFYLKSCAITKHEIIRFKILCYDGIPIERFHDYFITIKEYNRIRKIDKLLNDEK